MVLCRHVGEAWMGLDAVASFVWCVDQFLLDWLVSPLSRLGSPSWFLTKSPMVSLHWVVAAELLFIGWVLVGQFVPS